MNKLYKIIRAFISPGFSVYIFISFICLLSLNTVAQWQPVNTGSTHNFTDGCFVNDTTAFIISSDGQVMISLDKGNTWTLNTTIPGVYTALCHAGPDTLYAGGDRIYRSDNKGATWNLISTPGYTIRDLDFFRNGNGFLIVPDSTPCTWINGTQYFANYKVYRSLNYGASWQIIFDQMERTSRLQILDDNTAYIPGSWVNIQWHCAGGWVNSTKKTYDKGFTWGQAEQPQFGNTLYSFYSSQCGYFYQNFYQNTLYKTPDGGSSFVASYTEVNDPDIHQIEFLNEIDGHLLGIHTIYTTHSRGLAWSNDYTSVSNLNKIFGNGNGRLLCVGTNGTLLKNDYSASLYPDTIYRIKSDQSALDYSYVNVDSTEVKQLSFRNTGNDDLQLTLNVSQDYSISFDSNTFVNQLNISLSPFQDTTVYIAFTPHQVHNYHDSLLFTANHLEPVKIPLSGIGFHGLNANIISDTLICTDTLKIGADITVKAPAKLRICAGTQVIFMDNFKLTVEGTLQALGDSLHPVSFTARDTGNHWNGVVISNASYQDTSIFNYCRMLNACNSPSIQINKGVAIVDHCEISNAAGYGVQLIDFSNNCKAVIRNSLIYNCSGSGIECGSCDSTFIKGNHIYGCYHGIAGSTSSGIFIENNDIEKNRSEGVYGFGKFILKNNNIHENGGGVYVSGRQISLVNNAVYNNRSVFTGGIICGVSEGGSYIAQNLIFNNTTLSGNGGGLELAPNEFTMSPAIVINNTICNNKADNGNGNNFYATTNSASGLSIWMVNNVFFDISGNDNNIKWFPSVSTDINFNCIYPGAGQIPGLYNISDNPRFVKPTPSTGYLYPIPDYDWSLKQSSHCINKGDSYDSIFLQPFDFIGNPRIYNQFIDLGAYEFQGDFVEENDTTPIDTIVPGCLVTPNPAHDILKVSLGSDEPAEIHIYDAVSRLVIAVRFIKETQINLAGLSNGIYLYEVRYSSGLTKRGKFLRQ